MSDFEKKVTAIAQAAMVGQRIKRVGYVPTDVRDQYGWDANRPFEIELENGALIVASIDPEGNGPGTLYTNVEGCEVLGPLP